LRELIDPVTGRNFIDGRHENIKIDGSTVSLEIVLPYPGKSVTDGFSVNKLWALKIGWRGNVSASMYSKLFPHSGSAA
jgi:ATP-binding protein involved in chromosome partitioning